MLEIDAKIFEEFIKKLTLNTYIDSCIIQTDKKGMWSRVMAQDNIFYGKAVIPRSVFNTYEEGLLISLGRVEKYSDVILLRDILKNCSGKLKMKVEENKLLLSSGDTSATIILTAEEFVDNNCEKEPQLKFDKGFDIDHSILAKVNQHVTTMTTKDDTPHVRIKVDKKTVYFVVKRGENEIVLKAKADYKNGDFQMNGNYFNKIIAALSEKVNFSFDTEKPLRIKEKTEKVAITYVIAPIVPEDEEEKEGEKDDKKEKV